MQNLSKIEQETKKLQKMGDGVIVTSFLKLAPKYFVSEYFFTHTYSCTKFQVDWRSDKGITGGSTKHPLRAENDQKSPGRIALRLSETKNRFFFLIVIW